MDQDEAIREMLKMWLRVLKSRAADEANGKRLSRSRIVKPISAQHSSTRAWRLKHKSSIVFSLNKKPLCGRSGIFSQAFSGKHAQVGEQVPPPSLPQLRETTPQFGGR